MAKRRLVGRRSPQRRGGQAISATPAKRDRKRKPADSKTLPEWATIREAAERFSIDPEKLHQATRDRKVRAVHVGGGWVQVPLDGVRAWLQERSNPASKKGAG